MTDDGRYPRRRLGRAGPDGVKEFQDVTWINSRSAWVTPWHGESSLMRPATFMAAGKAALLILA